MRRNNILENLESDKQSLENILRALDKLFEYDKRFKALKIKRNDPMYVDAMAMQLGQIGENCSISKLSPYTREHYTNVNWHRYKYLRNFIYHEYEVFDSSIMWEFVNQYMETFNEQIHYIYHDVNKRIAREEEMMYMEES